LVALKYAVMVDGVTKLIMMKADVMDDFDTIKIATAYKVNGEVVDHLPYELTGDIEPVYTEFKGWKSVISGVRKYEDFPAEFKTYVEFIERETGVPIKIISVGPDREETIVR
jgi:adenylosuccinate synthase